MLWTECSATENSCIQQRRFLFAVNFRQRKEDKRCNRYKFSSLGLRCCSVSWRKNEPNNKWFFAFFQLCNMHRLWFVVHPICYRFLLRLSSVTKCNRRMQKAEGEGKKHTNKYCRDIHIQFVTFGTMRTIGIVFVHAKSDRTLHMKRTNGAGRSRNSARCQRVAD